VDELAAGPLAPARVAELAAAARAVVRPWLEREPDRSGLPAGLAAYDAEVDRLPATIEARRALYHEVLARPMPFELTPPGQDGQLAWEPAVQLQGAAVRYELLVAATPDLANPLIRQADLTATTYRPAPPLPPGTYYWRVIARTPDGAWQAAHARYADPATGRRYEGVMRFQLGSI
jgi:hypothetical protein